MLATSPDAAITWQWPASGPILRRFDGEVSGKKGISIGGTHGNQVRAAAAGKVVYTGSGLVGYGRLIILKHNNTYLSAYGHNRDLFVQEGAEVRAGQVIADMGSSGTNRIQLHFEIRRNGKPVDPLRYLPRR
jgi:lipoprotein NlpD